MRLLVDADACPVTNTAVHMARACGVDVLLFCDDAHEMVRDDAQVIRVMRGADSADFALVNRCARGDIVVTQDYALAAMCLGRGARVLSPNGQQYTDENITGLLSMRHASRKARRAGERVRGPRAREKAMDEAFEKSLAALLAQAE